MLFEFLEIPAPVMAGEICLDAQRRAGVVDDE